MHRGDAGGGVSGYEMSNLAPAETGLPFAVFVWPRGNAQHGARVMVTVPPWGAHPEATYSVEPFAFVAGTEWLSADQAALLRVWIALNTRVLEDFWTGRILYSRDLSAQIVPLDSAPPADHREAVVALRASAPMIVQIHWHDGRYVLTVLRLTSDTAKIARRFRALGFTQPVVVGVDAPSDGILLWRATHYPGDPDSPFLRGDEEWITGREAFRYPYNAIAAKIAVRQAHEAAARERPEDEAGEG